MKLNSFQSKRKHFHQNSYVNMMKKKKMIMSFEPKELKLITIEIKNKCFFKNKVLTLFIFNEFYMIEMKNYIFHRLS